MRIEEITVIDKCIFDFIYVAAMRDATMQKAYSAKGWKKSWLWDITDVKKEDTQRAKELIEKIKEELNKHIINILSGYYADLIESEEEKYKKYSDDLLSISINICDVINSPKHNPNYNKNASFKFGNAQKLINMTVKYFYITTLGQGRNIKDCFKYCHCPMDNQMLDIVFAEKKKDDNSWKYDGFKNAWSKEEFLKDYKGKILDKELPKRYSAFQSAVRELVEKPESIATMPIEYDYVKWNNKSSDKE